MRSQSFAADIKYGFDRCEVPTCPVCMEKLGSYGGPASLACGHNGCLECLWQVQCHNDVPLCPLCRTPFNQKLHLAPNLELRDALEKLDSVAFQSEPWGKQQMHSDSGHSDGNLGNSEQWNHIQASQRDAIARNASCFSEVFGDEQSDEDVSSNHSPELNFWTIAKALYAILTNRMQHTTAHDEPHSEGASDSDLMDVWSSVHYPSAPPLLTGLSDNAIAWSSVLEAEPPQWIPDSACKSCMHCDSKFQALTRGRHHCRFCGGIFCRSCSNARCLLPIKFMQKDPQRVCGGCYEKLEPVQQFLTNIVSNAAQIAIHDVTDRTCMRGWLNSPVGLCMQEEIYKATNTLRCFCKAGGLKSELSIPKAILEGAKGLAIVTIAKIGMVVTYKLGMGLVVARRDDGCWSPPTAVISFGLGWGLQAGGELTDFVIILPSTKAVKAFSSRVHVSVGAGCSASVGPVGRLAEAELCVGGGGAATCYTYSCSQGAFVGVSFEGNVVSARTDMNARFYGDPYLTPEDILFGSLPLPRAAAPLYGALQDLLCMVGL